MKILVVEDETSLRELMTAALKKEGYVVESAADFASAMDKAVKSGIVHPNKVARAKSRLAKAANKLAK